MRFKNIFERYLIFFQTVQIRFDFSQRINDGRFIFGNDVVRTLRKTSGIYLLDFHCKSVDYSQKLRKKVVFNFCGYKYETI